MEFTAISPPTISHCFLFNMVSVTSFGGPLIPAQTRVNRSIRVASFLKSLYRWN